MNKSILAVKSFAFAVEIIKLSRHLQLSKKEFIISNQILRSGTAIGALIREAQNAESNKDFIHKLSISQKECDETIYWLELLAESGISNKEELIQFQDNCLQILKMLRSSIITSKRKLTS